MKEDLLKLIQRKTSYLERNPGKEHIDLEIQILENILIQLDELEDQSARDSIQKHQAIIHYRQIIEGQNQQLTAMKSWIIGLFQVIGEHRAFIKANEPPQGYDYLPKAIKISPFQRLLQLLYL